MRLAVTEPCIQNPYIDLLDKDFRYRQHTLALANARSLINTNCPPPGRRLQLTMSGATPDRRRLLQYFPPISPPRSRSPRRSLDRERTAPTEIQIFSRLHSKCEPPPPPVPRLEMSSDSDIPDPSYSGSDDEGVEWKEREAVNAVGGEIIRIGYPESRVEIVLGDQGESGREVSLSEHFRRSALSISRSGVRSEGQSRVGRRSMGVEGTNRSRSLDYDDVDDIPDPSEGLSDDDVL